MYNLKWSILFIVCLKFSPCHDLMVLYIANDMYKDNKLDKLCEVNRELLSGKNVRRSVRNQFLCL